MGDIKLFRTTGNGVTELEGKSVVVEKALQALMERHLPAQVRWRSRQVLADSL